MKRIKLILPLALLLLLLAIALYPTLHASAEKADTDSGEAIQEAAPSDSAPSEAAPSLPPPLPPLPSPSVVLSTPMIFPSPTASSRRFTAI